VADIIGLNDVSTKDTGAGSKLKTGNLKRSYNMAKCKPGQIWNKTKMKCVSGKVGPVAKVRGKIGGALAKRSIKKTEKKYGKMPTRV
jgi:hypothetical protein